MTDDDKPRTRRIALVIDLEHVTSHQASYHARVCLRNLHHHLTTRSIDATPVRYDIDGWAYLASDPGR